MRTHPLNVSYLVIGLAFLGIATTWALHETDVIRGADLDWLLPLTLVLAGGIGLAAYAARALQRRSPGRDPYVAHDTHGTHDTHDFDGETR